MPMPLEGVRILELSMWGAVPLGVGLLADMGAEVIKVEEPVGGDRTRGIFVSTQLQTFLPSHPLNYVFEVANRGKKSVAIDVRKPEGAEAIYRLIPRCRAFITSLRRPALQKYGLDYQTLSKYNPNLVYIHLSSWGDKGPDKDLSGQDLTAQARGGLLSMMRSSPEAPPPPAGIFALADIIGSMQLAYAATLALLVQERHGIGQEVNLSLLGAQVTVGSLFLQIFLTTGKEPEPADRKKVKNPIRNLYRAGDGKWLALGMTEGDRFWARFCQAIGRPEWTEDPRFNTIFKRAENSEELISLLDEVFLEKSRDEWLKALKEHDATCAPVQTYGELARDPQVLENEYITTVDHPEFGPIKEPGITIKLSRTPGRVRGSAPQLGQHTEEVLLELGGYSWEELTRLKEAGVIL